MYILYWTFFTRTRKKKYYIVHANFIHYKLPPPPNVILASGYIIELVKWYHQFFFFFNVTKKIKTVNSLSIYVFVTYANITDSVLCCSSIFVFKKITALDVKFYIENFLRSLRIIIIYDCRRSWRGVLFSKQCHNYFVRLKTCVFVWNRIRFCFTILNLYTYIFFSLRLYIIRISVFFFFC